MNNEVSIMSSNTRPVEFDPNLRRQRKRNSGSSVRFPEEMTEMTTVVALHSLPPSSAMTPDEKSRTWYDSSDVAAFKAAIRTASAKIRLSPRQRAEDDAIVGTCQKQARLLWHYRSKTVREAQLDKGAPEEEAAGGTTCTPDGGASRQLLPASPGANNAARPLLVQQHKLVGPAADASSYRRDTENTSPVDSDDDEEEGHDCQDDEDDDEEEEIPRGLEHRTSFERQRNKFLAIKSVLAWQRRFKDRKQRAQQQAGKLQPASTAGVDSGDGAAWGLPSSASEKHSREEGAAPSAAGDETNQEVDAQQLALITSRASSYARRVATETGRADFYSAYPEFLKERPLLRRRVSAPNLSASAVKAAASRGRNSPTLGKRKSIDGTMDAVRSICASLAGNGQETEECESPQVARGEMEEDRMVGRPVKRRSITRQIVVGLEGVDLEGSSGDDDDADDDLE